MTPNAQILEKIDSQKRLGDAEIFYMVDQSEKKDRCQTLHSALKLYTNVKTEDEAIELNSSYLKTVNTQLKTIKNKLNPAYMSDSDYLDDSKLL